MKQTLLLATLLLVALLTSCSGVSTEEYDVIHQSGYIEGYNAGYRDGYEYGWKVASPRPDRMFIIPDELQRYYEIWSSQNHSTQLINTPDGGQILLVYP